jgi:hypothetical protein
MRWTRAGTLWEQQPRAHDLISTVEQQSAGLRTVEGYPARRLRQKGLEPQRHVRSIGRWLGGRRIELSGWGWLKRRRLEREHEARAQACRTQGCENQESHLSRCGTAAL